MISFNNFRFFIVLMLGANFLLSCANTSSAPLSGGAKDTIPPRLISMIPDQYAVNFKEKELIFTFNEYTELKEQNKNFTISPPLPNKKPQLRVKGKSVIVKIPEELADSTTYFISFGQSVVDVNEGNPAEALNILFSTGDVLDTMMYVGVIKDAFTLEPIEGFSAFLYKDNYDSIPYQKNPSALTRTDKNGAFIIKGLKDIDYKFVAVEDVNNNYRYDPGSEKIAFSGDQIKPISLDASDSLAIESLPIFYAFSEIASRQILKEYKRPEERQLFLAFNTTNPIIDTFKINGIDEKDIIKETSANKDTIMYWLIGNKLPDSINARFVSWQTDTLDQLSPKAMDLRFPKFKKPTDEEDIVPLVPNIVANPKTIVSDNVDFIFKTPLIKAVDTSKFEIKKITTDMGVNDTTIVSNFNFTSKSLREYQLSTKWDIASRYIITIYPYAFVDVYNITNDTITKIIETADPDKFGKIILSLSGVDKQFVIQLIQKKNIVNESIISADGEYVFSYIDAGKYQFRVIEDDNANGKWDPGIYFEGKQSERVVFLSFKDSEDLEVKATWEIKQNIDMSTIYDIKEHNHNHDHKD